MGSQSNWALLAYGDTGWGDELLRGLGLTIQISICAYLVGFALGLLGAGAKLSSNVWLRRLADFYTTIIRAVPELLLILLLFYSGTSALTALLVRIGFAAEDIQISGFAAAVAALGFIYGAYMTEILRGAIQAVPKGQMEAARAFGMRPPLRFRRILFPLMLRYALPGMGNQWLNITKDSAYITVTGSVVELLSAGANAAGATKKYLFFYTVTACAFLVLTVASMLLLAALEKRLNRGLRR
ncbi:MAG TPA: ABC transporter permease subunit [Terriglobia bacterium]|nr:ABC transporter permease subunit [Terriglobia bacterium]